MSTSPVRFFDRLFAFTLWMLPTRLISRLAFALAQVRAPTVKNALIGLFLQGYPAIDMSEAAEPDPKQYACFNDFFTRELAAGSRPVPDDKARLLCPVDGQLGMFGSITGGRLFQTKGVAYSLHELLAGDDSMVAAFHDGHYATLYLAPHNYHRVHMPLAGCLHETRYIPGRLFGVNPRCVRSLARLFTRNERLVSCFDTEIGPVALVMVGAFIVGGMRTVAAGRICPPHQDAESYTSYNSENPRNRYARGAEMGHFMLGSSVILLAGPASVAFDPDLAPGQNVRLNQSLGRLKSAAWQSS